MAKYSADLIYDLLVKYLFPILRFANVRVDEKGILRPIGQNDPDLVFTDEGKTLIIVDSQIKYQEVKAKNDEFQIFNPFSIPKQTVFLANMVMMAANNLDVDHESKDMVYDEDLDEWIPKNGVEVDENITNDSGNIKIFENRDPEFLANIKIVFAHTDSSGNPTDTFASFSHSNTILAMVGAMINLIKQFQKTITPDFISTEVAVMNIEKTLNKISASREKEKREKPVKLHISSMEDEEELLKEMSECDKDNYYIDVYLSMDTMFTPFDKRDQYSPSNAKSKMWNHMFLPSFKTLSSEEETVQEISDLMDLSQFDGIDFQL